LRKSACHLLLAGTWAIASAPVVAQAYPTGSLRIISPYPPGGGTDLLARAIAQRITERHNVPALVDNRPGANGTIGTGLAAKSTPDGHTMVVVASAYAAGASLYRNLPYDQTRDLAPVSLLASGPLVLVVHPSLPVRSTNELVAFARARPGQLGLASSGLGSLPHLSAELFASMTGTQFNHVPYKGPAAALIDLLSGQVSVYFVNVMSSLPYVKSGKLRALGVTTPQRSAIAPGLPTIAEAGLKDYDMTNWYGLLVPSATPRATVTRLSDEVKRILALPELQVSLAAVGMTPVANSPAEFSTFLAREMVKYARVTKEAGVKPE
jgi:tripartite-type tricarboxylate transporter receptor subunit TctC